jgi:hypothetical protein
MKIYTNVFDLARICPRRFWVSPYSDFKIGVKIAEKGAPSAKSFVVKAGLTELTPDEDKVDGFTTYTLKSADTGFVEYTIEVEGVSEKLKLVQITTDSTVFEVGGSGGGDVPADVATKTWVNSQISDFVTEDALTAYVTEDWVESQISDFVEEDALTAYATKGELTAYAEKTDLTSYAEKTDLTAYAEKTDLTAYAEKTDLTAYAEKTDLTDYYKKSETSSATELADAFAGAGGGGAVDTYDVSDSPIQSETLIRQALVDNTCLPQTIVLNEDDSIEVFDVEGTLDLHQEGPLASLIPDAVKVLVGTKVTNLGSRCFIHAYKCNEIVLPNSLSGISVGSYTGEVFSGIPAKRIAIPDSMTTFGNGTIFWNWSYGEVVDFGNTRLTIPAGGVFRTNSPTVKYIVPDSLYSQWITTGNWANVSAQVFPHSQMPGAVTCGAYAGATGTPAAIANMQTVYETDWETLSASALSSTFYVVVPDPE